MCGSSRIAVTRDDWQNKIEKQSMIMAVQEGLGLGRAARGGHGEKGIREGRASVRGVGATAAAAAAAAAAAGGFFAALFVDCFDTVDVLAHFHHRFTQRLDERRLCRLIAFSGGHRLFLKLSETLDDVMS